MKHTRHILQIFALAVALLAMGPAAWAASTFTVSNPTGSTFRITRTGNTSVSETIDWRVVSLSAIAGTHFTGYNGNYSGTVTFNVNDTYKDVTITENTPGDDAYKYQDGTSRKYRFEVLDRNGDILASCDRSRDNGTSVTAAAYNIKDVTVNSGTITVKDENYAQAYHEVPVSTYFSNAAPQNYFVLAGAELRMTLSFQAKEKDDGYQHVQILVNQTSNHDEGAGDNNPGTMNYSSYMATFCHKGGSTNTTYSNYVFPDVNHGANCGNVGLAWSSINSSNDVGELRQQYFNTNCRADDGRLVISTKANLSSFSTLGIRFDASGNNEDTWYADNTVAHIQAVDGTAPTVLNNYKVSGGRHQKGNTIYVSVPFKEIVTVTGTPTLSSNWGTLSYTAGSGSNVLTFKGTIDPSDNNAFSVSGYSLNGGTIKDLAGNSFSGSISHNFGTVLDADYVWSTSDFNSLNDGSYEIYTTQDLRHLALMVNSGNNNCSGLTFHQTNDITYRHTTNWNNSSSQENNYTAIGTNTNKFQGTFDGQGNTISGIRLFNPADYYQGLFGYIKGGTVRGVNLADERITGYSYVGGIAGDIFEATVEDCSVAADVCIHAVQSNSGSYGGIVGISYGSVLRCLSRASLTVANAVNVSSYGAIIGTNNTTGHAVKDCIVIGATVPSVNNAGAIIGNNNENSSTYVQRNYYRACTVAGVANATGVGVGFESSNNSPHDVTANQGAQALYSLTLPSGVSLVRTASATLPGTGNKTYTTGADIDGTPYAYEGASLSFSYTGAAPADGYKTAIYVNGVQATDNGDGTYTATMPAEDATVTVSTIAIPWSGSGNSANDPYLIQYPSQLDLLATNVSAGNSYSGKYFALANDITYSPTTAWNNSSSTENNYTAIGTSDHMFQGTFDGQNHTISGIRIYKGGANGDEQGLFGAIGSGGIVRGVNLADARITGCHYVGGIAGELLIATVEDCTVSANVCIHAVQASSYYHGGIVGYNQGTMQRCLSRARLTVTDASYCENYGAIVGFNNTGHAVKDCIVIGATVPEVTYRGAIIGWANMITNVQRNYYRACTVAGVENATGVGVGYDKNTTSPHDLTDNQGARALYSLTLPSGVSLVRTASATLPGTGNATYTTGADIDGTPYAFAGATVTLAFAGGSPQGLVYSVNGTPIEGSSFEMPAAEVTVTVNASVSYIDADGTARNAVATSLSGSETTLGTDDKTTWYVASSDISFDHEVLIYGDVHLILADGITMTMTETDDLCIWGYNSSDNYLTIYGQSEGTGTLIATNENSTALGVGNITINGGRITATAKYDSILADNNLTINGGVINATSQIQDGLSCKSGNIIINGGQVATNAMVATSSRIILGYSKGTDRISIGSAGCHSAKGVYIAAGKSMTDDNNNTFTAPANSDYRIYSSLNNTTLLPAIPAAVELTLIQGTKDGVTAYWGTFYEKAAGYSLPVGATAYTMDGNKNFYRLGTDGSRIPAGVPVVIVSEVASITLTKVDGEITATDNAPGGNVLRGTNGLVELVKLDGYYKVDGKIPYVLSVSDGAIGFRQYYYQNGIPAHKAYYPQ